MTNEPYYGPIRPPQTNGEMRHSIIGFMLGIAVAAAVWMI